MNKYTTEAKVQCELYHKLTLLGYDVYPELPCMMPNGRRIRVDLSVFIGDELLMLIEVKKNNFNKRWKETKQFAKYESTGHPFIYCRSMAELDQTIAIIQGLGEPIERPI